MAHSQNTLKYVLVESARYSEMIRKLDSCTAEPAGSQQTTEPSSKPLQDGVISPPPSRESHQEREQHHGGELSYQTIIEYLPKIQRSKANALLTHLSGINNLSWNSKGNIVLNSNLLPNSQIVDVLKYCINQKNSFVPFGWSQIAQVLSESSVPLSLITNAHARQEIAQLQTGHGQSHTSLKQSLPPGISQKHFKAEHTPSHSSTQAVNQHKVAHKPINKTRQKSVKAQQQVKWLSLS